MIFELLASLDPPPKPLATNQPSTNVPTLRELAANHQHQLLESCESTFLPSLTDLSRHACGRSSLYTHSKVTERAGTRTSELAPGTESEIVSRSRAPPAANGPRPHLRSTYARRARALNDKCTTPSSRPPQAAHTRDSGLKRRAARKLSARRRLLVPALHVC